MRFALTLVLAALVAGCGASRWLAPYRMEIQQGNYVTQGTASQLAVGMTRDQVRFLLGTPLIADPFHANRWDYVYRLERANSRQVEERRMTLFFKDDRLERVEGDIAPGTLNESPAAALPPATKPESALAPLPPVPAETAPGSPTSPSIVPQGPDPASLPPAAQPPMGQR